ncbi:MAG: SDR family oxidoreductase, partial [Hyphomicrobiales bacterium]|nr:SDR family oxidoreductase [Hyphomicrobiales bacterium]
CIGLLQDSWRERTGDVHGRFVARLVEALASQCEAPLLFHLSIPGGEAEDATEFSRTKREAERLIAAASIPFVILRPGFVVASEAYGGSALIRALAALPISLPKREADRPFATTDVRDIIQTIAVVARRWRSGERRWAAVWDVMERNPTMVDGVIAAFRRKLGGPSPVIRLPHWLMDIGATSGDLSAHLGWRPPIRSTAIREMRRGVKGDPEAWIAATGIEPASLDDVLVRLPATAQERWFGRLYLIKALVLASLVVFWSLSGIIALTVAFPAATGILAAHGFPQELAHGTTVLSSIADISIGTAIAFRKTCRWGLLSGIALSFFYCLGAAIITPELWVEPLGALVKTGPAIVLMLVALAILDDR